MKKMFMFLTVFIGFFALAACNTDSNGENGNGENGNGDDSSALVCREEGADPLRVGMNLVYPPFEMRDDNNQPTGVSVDIAKAFGEYIGCEVEIVDVDFANLIDSLNLGDIDLIIASMSRTPARAELITFSDPYMYFKIIGLINQDFADEYGITEDSSVEDLLAISSATYVGVAGQVSSSLPIDLGIDFSRVSSTIDLDSAAARVAFGDDDVLMMSAAPVVRNHLVNPDTTLVLWDPFQSSPISMGMRHGEDELLELANSFISKMDEEGGLYEQLSEDWDDAILEILDRYGLEFFLSED